MIIENYLKVQAEDLNFLNKELLLKKCVGIDTEFRRTNKDNMRLGLIQVNDTEEIYLIDPVLIREPKDNCSFLFSDSVIKVFHSCKEDIEAVYSWTGRLMKNIFDTQIANAFLGGDYSVSYQGLVENKIGITLNKGETRSNWLRRPLTDSQLRYAASDVEFLIELFEEQNDSLHEQKKIHWLKEEVEFIILKTFSDQLNELNISNKLTKQEENTLFNKFNEIISYIAEEHRINSTFLFSKKIQKDFLKLVLCRGIEEGLETITKWRSELIEEPLRKLLKDL